MPNGTVEILYWEAQPLRLGKPSAGHVALLITPSASEPQDFSDFPRQMREHLSRQGQLYISFYGGGNIGYRNYRSYRDDINPSAGADGRQPDGQISLSHLDVGAMLHKARELVLGSPHYSRFASMIRWFARDTEVSNNQYNCVSFVLELLFAGGIGQYIPAWNTIERIGEHLKSWMPNNALSWFALISILVAPVGYLWWHHTLKAKDNLAVLIHMKDNCLASMPSFRSFVQDQMMKSIGGPLLPSDSEIVEDAVKVLEQGAIAQVTNSASAPKGLNLLFVNTYNYSPILFMSLVILVCSIITYQVPVFVDGFKKLFIRSPTDVYGWLEKLLLQNYRSNYRQALLLSKKIALGVGLSVLVGAGLWAYRHPSSVSQAFDGVNRFLGQGYWPSLKIVAPEVCVFPSPIMKF